MVFEQNIYQQMLFNDLVSMPEYAHFTSPIRRMSDCVCHYLLKFIYLRKENLT